MELNREQIEEMANVYYEAMLKARGTLGSMNNGAPKWYAKELYAAGYRKASEVAEEIIKDIEGLLSVYTDNAELSETMRILVELIKQYLVAELKKKYTEDDDGT